MTTRHLHEVSTGKPRYYTDDGEAIYEHGTGKAAFYISNGTVYSYNGRAVYWISDNYLYAYDGGTPSLYFSE